ncbi:MAG: hypothetical protein GXP53_14520 [Deltaproteobacteria bacterium]|nr:hypothetical protein [Deltaproteobacteria bacterium]
MKTDKIKTVSAPLLFCNLVYIIGALMIWGGLTMPKAATAGEAGKTDTKTVITIGNSHIYKNNITAARTAAIAEARKIAVQTAAASVLSRQNLMEGFETFSAVVSERRREFIGSYRILKEFKTDNDYSVLVETSIMMDSVKSDLAAAGLVAAGGTLPAVLFMVAEKEADDIGYSFWWTKGRLPFSGWAASPPMLQVFRENGFTVIEPDMAAEETAAAGEGLKLTAAPTDFDAITFARRLGAELVVVGTATAEVMPNELGEHLRAYKGSVSLRALKCDTGEQTANINDSAIITGEDPITGNKNALSSAGIAAGRDLVQRLLAKWKATPVVSGHITVTVTGTDILARLEAIKGVLATISGVSTLMMSEMTPDKAILSVDYSGSANELADTLLMKSFPGFGILINGVDEAGVALEIK